MMLSSLLVCDNTRRMLSSKTPHFDSENCEIDSSNPSATKTEQSVVEVTQEIVRRIVGLDSTGSGRQFDRLYQMFVVPVYEKYWSQLDQMAKLLTATDRDMATTAMSFDGVLDKLFDDGEINAGRVSAVLAFIGCVAQQCIEKEIIASNDVDQLAEVMGRQLAARIDNLVRTHLLPVQCIYMTTNFNSAGFVDRAGLTAVFFQLTKTKVVVNKKVNVSLTKTKSENETKIKIKIKQKSS